MRPTNVLYRSIAALALSCLAAGRADAAAQPYRLDLDRAIELAVWQNRSLVLDVLDIKGARLAVEGAESRFDIEVRPVLEIGTLDDETTSRYGLETAKRFGTGARLSATVTSDDFDRSIGRRARLAIEFNQPLFRRFGRLVNEEPVVRATSVLRRSERLYFARRSDLVLDVIESYESILRFERQVAADRESLDRAEELLRSTRAKEALGRSTRIDSLRVELQQGLARSRLAANTERLESERQALAELLGLDPDIALVLEPTGIFSIDLPPADDAVERALDNRLDYAQALQDRDDAVRGARIAENLLLPDVTLTGRYERADKPLTFFGGDRSRWFVGVRGETDLNDRAARIDLEQARLEEVSAEQRIRVVQLGIAREVRQSMLAYRRARADLATFESNLDHASARLELARRLFETGRTDNFSVTDAEEAYLDAESRLLAGETDATLAAWRFLHTIGVLIEYPAMLGPEALQ